ncbi:MAG: Gfo/Idh/MocA family oxidoreductase [Sedimentisphaerales bacterium]|nr:Gfo/Idh/MocA family oxidoreductase [Sedimentisphaerales bacterium]
MENESLEEVNKDKRRGISRRDFLGGAAAAAAFTIVPRHVLGGPGYKPPSEKLNVAGVGIGGMGRNDIRRIGDENIVALCDVDEKYAAEVFNKYPKAKKYRDFRRMLEKQKDIDAVIVATPDHNHAVVAMAAIKMGKHVYCEKPLTYCISEARKLTEAARQAKVATQMGIQGHSGEGIRLICEWIWAGAIGPVRQVQVWTNRPTWRQGIDRPKETPPVPATLDWDLWLGPAPYRPYNPVYLPFNWRAWRDFGTGSLGDMACHIIDPVFWAMKLGHPTSIEATYAKMCLRTDPMVAPEYRGIDETYPLASIIHYEFPARQDMPAVKMTWYDGGLIPPRPEELEPGRRMGGDDGGVLFIGDKGKIMCGCYGEHPRLIPEAKMQQYERPAKTIPRIEQGHWRNWIQACKGGEPAGSNFDYAGPLTEVVLLGNVAILAGEKLYWDGANMKVTNVPEANEYLHRQYRQGWTL